MEFESNLAALITDGNLVKSSSEIYQIIATKLKMTKQAVYLAVKRYMKLHHSKTVETDGENFDHNDDSDDDADYLPSSKFTVTKDAIRFTVDIRGCNIFPQDVGKTNDRWKSEVIKILWEFSRLPCAWRFERYREVYNEVNIHANCQECEGTVFVFTDNGKKDLTMVLKSSQPSIVHNEKIHLATTYRDEILNMLKADSNCVVQAKLADHFMISHDLQPAHLPNLHALDQIRYRENKKKCLHEDPSIALMLMKNMPLYNNCIGDIGLDPFYCSYGTELQKEFLRREIAHSRCIASVDSTGMCKCIHEKSTVFIDFVLFPIE